MVELTIGQLVRIVIAVLVFVVIVFAVVVAFKDFIIPYFEGIGPGENSTIGVVWSLLESVR